MAQQRAQDEAGNIWEVDAQGNPVRLIQQAQPRQIGGIVTRQADPNRALDRTIKQQTITGNSLDNQRDAATIDAQVKLADAQARKAEAEAVKAAREVASGGLTTADKNTIRGNLKATSNLAARLAETRSLYEQGPGATEPGTFSSLRDFLPTTPNRQFNDSANAMRGFIGSALGLTGGQLNTEKEQERAIGPYIPNSWDTDAQIVGKLSRIQDLIGTARASAAEQLGEPVERDSNPVAAGIVGGGAGGAPGGPPNPFGGGGGGTAIASGTSQSQRDPVASALVDRYVVNGGSEEDLNAELARMGIPAVRAGSLAEAQRYFKKNPNDRSGYGDIVRYSDTSLLNRIAGSDFGAGAIAAGDAVIPLSLFGKEAAMGVEASRNASPTASFIGTLAGGVPAALGAELGLARAGLSQIAASRAGDALYGGVQGFGNAGEGEGLAQGAVGALSGLAGGALGRATTRGLGRVAYGLQNDSVQYLSDRGVPLTVGQALGGTAKQVEDQLTGYPIVGGTIANRRGEGLQAFNRAAFDDASAPLQRQTNPLNLQTVDTGASGIEQLRAIRGQGYDGAVNGRVAVQDPEYLTAFNDARQRASAIPNTGPAIVDEIDASVPGYFTNNVIAGPNAQAAIREVRGIRSARQSDPLGHRTGQVLRDVEGAIQGLFDRQAPGFSNDLGAANAVNTNLKVLEDAVKAAKNQGDELFMPSQLNTASVRSATNFGGNGATTQRPFYELAQAGQEVLPSRTADSGTAARLAIGGLGTLAVGGGAGAGYSQGEGVGAGVGSIAGLGGLAALLAAGGSRPAQRLAVSALLDRPDALRTLGGRIQDLAPYAGVGGVLPALGFQSLLTQ